METLGLGPETAPRLTKIEAIVEAQFRHIEWRPGTRSFGHTADNYRLVTGAYGERIIKNGTGFAVESTATLEDMVEIDRAIAAQLLGDEGSKPPLLTEAPYPYDSITGKSPRAQANNDAWLATIRGGHWPIPASYKRDPFTSEFKPTPQYEPHDYGDKHLAFMLLAPREMQKEITEAAHHGLTQRLRALDHPNESKGLILPGERADEKDSLAYSYRGKASRGDMDAINAIDQVSDDPDFLPFITRLASLPDEEARQAFVKRYAALAVLPGAVAEAHLRSELATDIGYSDAEDWVSDEKGIIKQIGSQRRMMIGITNFNMRYREGRDLEPEEQADAANAYLNGLIRVAGKLAS